MHQLLRPTLLAAALLGLLPGCNKIDFGDDEGYSARDSYNQPLGATDKTDWTSDGSWKKQERELFKDSGIDLSQAQKGGVGSLSFYPNACAEQGIFQIQSVSTRQPPAPPLPPVYSLEGRFVLTDKKYRTLHSGQLRLQTDRVTNISLNLPADKFKDGQLYRLYYILYDADQVLHLKGHGDIKIKR